MTRFLKHSEIDRQKWDRCIESSENGLIYGLSWYLDCVSPGWEALVYGDYLGVMPLPVKRKYGIRFLAQPIFTQQLGWFGTRQEDDTDVLFLLRKKYFFGFISLNNANKNISKSKELTNLVLSLDKPYEKLQKGFSSNHKRNVKKAKKEDLSITELSVTDFQTFYEKARWSEKFDLKDSHFSVLVTLTEKMLENKQGHLLGVNSSKGELLGVCLLTEFKGRITYLFPITAEAGYGAKAQFFLIDYLIRTYSGSKYLLDFEGSSIEGIKRFYEGFGAAEETYPILTFYRNKRGQILIGGTRVL